MTSDLVASSTITQPINPFSFLVLTAEGDTLFHLAVKNSQLDVFQVLLKKIELPVGCLYDGFLSFDTRDNFVSHLHKALSNHQIKTFIDYNLPEGDDFPPAPLTAIEESLLCLDAFTCPTKSNLKLFNSYLHNELKRQFLDTVRESLLQECSKGKMNFDKARSHLMEAANISGWDSRVIREGMEGNNNNRSSCDRIISRISRIIIRIKKLTEEIIMLQLATLNLGLDPILSEQVLMLEAQLEDIIRIEKLTEEDIIMLQLAKLSVTGSSFQDSIQLPRQSRNTSKQDLNTKSKHSSRNLDDATKDLMMEKILRAAGALRGREVAAKKLQESNREAHLESRKTPRFAFQHHSTLVAATLLVAVTFLAALRPSSELLKVELINSSQTGKQGTPITDLFVLFNSAAFISLIVLIFSITQKLSVQPWFLFVEFSIVGAYVCSVMVVTPHLVAAVLLIGGFILLVACFKYLGFHKMALKWLQRLCTKVQSQRKSTAPDAYLPLVSNTH